MKVNTKYTKVSKTARYLSYGNISSETKYFWIVLHGSLMTAEQMIYKFENFNEEQHFVIAPEGLNRQYLKNFGGEAVANWMTSRDRLYEIEDFSNYLSDLFQKYVSQLPKDCEKIVLGFSQGGTTMFRWLQAQKMNVDKILAYSCWIPEDIELSKGKTNFDNITLIYTYGQQDQYLSEDRIIALKKVIEKNNLHFSFEAYEGDHRVDKKQLAYLFSKYITK